MNDQITYKGEILRKLIHIFSIVFAICLVLFGRELILLPLILISIIFIMFDYSRIRFKIIHNIYTRFFRDITRPAEKSKLTGASFSFIGASLTILLFSESAAFIGLLFLSIGDSMAALIGRKYGKTKFGMKSIEGSVALFLSCSILAFIFTSLPILSIILTAFVATVLEAIIIPMVDDNITIPVGSAFAIQTITKIL